MPLMTVVFLNIFPIENRGKAMGMMGIAMIFAPAIGPTLSGYIVEHYDWRVLFYMILPFDHCYADRGILPEKCYRGQPAEAGHDRHHFVHPGLWRFAVRL